MHQAEMVSIDDLVPAEHSYRGFMRVFDFAAIRPMIETLDPDGYYKGYGAFRLFLCCLLQFLEDASDRDA